MSRKRKEFVIHVSNAPLSSRVFINSEVLAEAFGHTSDLNILPVRLVHIDGILVFFSTLVDSQRMNEQLAQDFVLKD